MRMAKATESDLDAAMNLMLILQAVDGGYYPDKPEDDDETAPVFFDHDDIKHLEFFFQRVKECLDKSPGFIGRIVGGMHTILRNNILDPDLDYLELHPRLKAIQQSKEP